MRYSFARTIIGLAKHDKRIVFLTGDLGYSFFEELQATLQDRFINAGVAEENMATVAAGLAYVGWKPWIFSIAPFVTIKILEQLRNDICLSNANVKIVGQGGGYDYELAGPTHHALDDIGSLLTLPNMEVFIPAVVNDIGPIIKAVNDKKGPAYIRLTRARKVLRTLPPYKHVRRVIAGNKLTLVTLGSIIDKGIEATIQLSDKIDLWIISKLPVNLPQSLWHSINKTKQVCVLEEHCVTGGLGQYLATQILSRGIKLNHFIHLYARWYPTKKTGSRDFYLKQSGLDTASIIKTIKKII